MTFDETFYFIDIYDEHEPFLAARAPDEKDTAVRRFQEYFEKVLLRSDFWSMLSLTPYFSWTDEYWDMDFSFRHSVEERPEYEVGRMTSFYQRFDFRKNQLAKDMLERLQNGAETRQEPLAVLNDEILLTYFPNTNSALQELYGEELDKSLRVKILEIGSLGSANAWANIIPLVDENYDNRLVLKMIFEHQELLPEVERSRLRHLAQNAPMENPLTEYWSTH